MIISKKTKSNNENFTFVDACVRKYFDTIKNEKLSGKELSELFRYSMCRLLDLETRPSCKRIEELGKLVVNELRPIYDSCLFFNDTLDFRQGILEMCVHCLEMSRKRAGL